MIARPDGVDAGLSAGGSFVLDPGDVFQADAYVAGVIMGDPSLAKHFDCVPEWKPAGAAVPEPVAVPEAVPVADPAPVPEPKRGGKKAGGGPAW
jgi:hypothetical protein